MIKVKNQYKGTIRTRRRFRNGNMACGPRWAQVIYAMMNPLITKKRSTPEAPTILRFGVAFTIDGGMPILD